MGAFAQDIIIKKDGDEVKAKIVEINDTQIKYYEFRDINNLIFTIDRALIKEIRFETGTKYKEERPGSSELYYADDRINNLKMNFIAIGEGDLIFTFERAIDAGSSWEGTFKLYGLGDSDDYENQSGFGVNAGYKIKFGNIFKRKNTYRPNHILQGAYLRPVIGYSNSKSIVQRNNRTYSDSYAHFGLDLGQQWILRNMLSIEIYLGFHYYGGSFTRTDEGSDSVSRNYQEITNGDLWGGENRAISFGLRVGGLFTKKGVEKKKKR